MSILVSKAQRRHILPLSIVLLAGLILTWWTVENTDHTMRESHLHTANLVSKSVNLERLQSLSGTEADLGTPDYLRLKEQLARIAGADENCRFIYLMGRLPDGRVFFYVDNEPVGSEDEAPAGQIYEEVSAEYLSVFDTKNALTVGPVTDRWGNWITSLIPIEDPQNGKLLAVLGMDVDAGMWQGMLVQSAILPLLLTLAFVMILLGFSRLRADIAKRKLAEDALRESKTHLHTLIETLPEIIWAKDPNGVYLSCNPRFELFFGDKETNIIGKTDYNYVDKELADFFRQKDKAALAAGKPTVNEEEVTFANDGHTELLETTKTPMFDSQGKLIGILGIGRDITERKRAEEALQHTLAEAKQMNRLMSGREDRVLELKKEVNELLKNQGQEQKYGSAL
ncbi:MAG: PAS domain-containing protein [Melioribacteraceae bacterium]|nr:PAS domain-containing protein [Melioribacteraceae bacterium]